MPIDTLIKFRKGTASQWSASNPVLASGEPGWDTTNRLLKIGDGVSSWSSLNNTANYSLLDVDNIRLDLNTISTTSGNLFISPSGGRLGINTTTPSGALHLIGSGLVASVTGTSPNSLLHLYSATSGDSIFNVEGTNGSLFSITDNLSGSLMSVNNNAGLPVFEVFSDDSIIGGRFNQNDFVINSSGNIGIGNSGNNSYKLNVVGNTNVSGVLSVSGTVVSVSGHQHTTSDISNFNSSVSGLLPVKDIVSGTGISISSSSGIYTISSTVNEVTQAASLVTTVFNKTGSPIPKMSVVYINGGQGDLPTISLAAASAEMTSSKTYGITYENISNMSSGKVIVAGALTGLNTDQFNPTAPTGDVNGSILWLSPTISGSMTTTKPSAPYHMVAVGTVVRTHQNEGVIEVRIQNGFELEELHNVAISGVTNGQFLQYNGSGLWIPSSSGNFSALQINNINVSTSGHSHTSSDITDFNSSVSGLLPVTNITGGSNITVSQSGTVYSIAVTGSLGLTTEEVDDRVSNLLVAGSGISLDYNDGSDTLTIHNTSISPDEIEEYTTTANFPSSGNLNILYVATDTGQLYKWDGEFYYENGPQGASTGSHSDQHASDGSDPIQLREYVVPSFTSNTNNLVHNNKDILYLSSDANNRELSGLVAPSGCNIKLLVNTNNSNTIILDHQSTNSDPSNRFMIYTGADYYLLAGYSVSILYDTNASRWRVL